MALTEDALLLSPSPLSSEACKRRLHIIRLVFSFIVPTDPVDMATRPPLQSTCRPRPPPPAPPPPPPAGPRADWPARAFSRHAQKDALRRARRALAPGSRGAGRKRPGRPRRAACSRNAFARRQSLPLSQWSQAPPVSLSRTLRQTCHSSDANPVAGTRCTRRARAKA
jgi:hypothetical protein